MTEYAEVLGEKTKELEALGLPYSIHKNSPTEDGFALNGYYVSVFTNDTWVAGGTHAMLVDAIQHTLDVVGREGQKMSIECEFRGARASDLRAIAAIMDELAGSYPVYKTEF